MSRLLVALVVLFLAGCDEGRREFAALHHPTAATMQVRLTTHTGSAAAFVAAQAESRTIRGSFVALLVGTSNSANWGEAFAVQVRTPANRLEVGQLISFRDYRNRVVCHPIVGKDSGGWITAGTANSVSDRGRVTDDNLIARVVSVHTWPQEIRK